MPVATRCLLSLALSATMAAGAAAQTSPYGAYTGANPTVGVPWGTDLEAAKAQAKQSGKLVLVHFWSNSCGPCRVLDNQVFNQPAVAGAINQQFVPVKINTDESPIVAQAFGVSQVPTDIILTADGKPVDRMISPASPMAYVSQLMGSVAKSETQGGGAYQNAAAASPYNQKLNSAYANLSIPAAAPPAPAAPAAVATGEVNPYAVNNPYATGDRYGASAPGVASAEPASPAGQPIDNPYAAVAAAMDQSSKTKPAINPPPINPASPSTPVEKPAATQTVRSQPKLPPGAPPVCLDGYCPVTLKHEHAWREGDVAWGAVHRGRTYLFAGQAERDEFLKNPDSYSPVLSGIDPVALLEANESIPGKRSIGVEYKNSVYLFSTQENLKRFWANPDGYAQGARQAMNLGSSTLMK